MVAEVAPRRVLRLRIVILGEAEKLLTVEGRTHKLKKKVLVYGLTIRQSYQTPHGKTEKLKFNFFRYWIQIFRPQIVFVVNWAKIPLERTTRRREPAQKRVQLDSYIFTSFILVLKEVAFSGVCT